MNFVQIKAEPEEYDEFYNENETPWYVLKYKNTSFVYS